MAFSVIYWVAFLFIELDGWSLWTPWCAASSPPTVFSPFVLYTAWRLAGRKGHMHLMVLVDESLMQALSKVMEEKKEPTWRPWGCRSVPCLSDLSSNLRDIQLHLQKPICWPPDSIQTSQGNVALLCWLFNVVCCVACQFAAYHSGIFLSNGWLLTLCFGYSHNLSTPVGWAIKKPLVRSARPSLTTCPWKESRWAPISMVIFRGTVSPLLSCAHFLPHLQVWTWTNREIKTGGLSAGLPAAQNPALGKRLTSKPFVFSEIQSCTS